MFRASPYNSPAPPCTARLLSLACDNNRHPGKGFVAYLHRSWCHAQIHQQDQGCLVVSQHQVHHCQRYSLKQPYLEQVDFMHAVLVHETADCGHRTDTILAVSKEAGSHMLLLQLLLFMHMAGGVARHGWVVPKHRLTLCLSHCLWHDVHLQGWARHHYPLVLVQSFLLSPSDQCMMSGHSRDDL